MNKSILASLAAACFASAHAAPVTLANDTLDQISAGGNFSYVQGGGTAGSGTVNVNAITRAFDNGRVSRTNGFLVVRGSGTDLQGYGYGTSGASGTTSSVGAQASVDQGSMLILVRTSSVSLPNGTDRTRSSALVVTTGSGARASVTQATAHR